MAQITYLYEYLIGAIITRVNGYRANERPNLVVAVGARHRRAQSTVPPTADERRNIR